jgi:hypothetical protein
VQVDKHLDIVDEVVRDCIRLLLAQPAVGRAGEKPVHVEHVDRRVPGDPFHRERIRDAKNPDRAPKCGWVQRANEFTRDEEPVEFIAVDHGRDSDRGPGPGSLNDVDRQAELEAARQRGDRREAARPARAEFNDCRDGRSHDGYRVRACHRSMARSKVLVSELPPKERASALLKDVLD